MAISKSFSKISGRFPLRVVLIFPFILQLLAVVIVVGYLSFSSGQKSVNEVASDLRNEITARIEQHLVTYLNVAHFVNQMNADALRLAHLDLSKPEDIQRHFWQQLQQLNIVSYISFSSTAGQYIGVERREDRSIMNKKKTDIFYLYTEKTEHLADNKGGRAKLTQSIENYDPRQRSWYKDTVATNKPIWSDIYALTDPKDLSLAVTQTISANQPYYDDKGNLKGVLGTDIFLSQISAFLSTLKIGKTGQTFIMEKTGLVVASSTSEKPYRINPKNREEVLRLKVEESQMPLIRNSAEFLKEQFGQFDRIKNSKQLGFKLEGEQQFLQIKPYHDERGIDWIIVVIIPESDFMDRIKANIHLTIVLFLVTLLVAIFVGIFTAKWVAEPIERLKIAASNLSSGEWNQELPIDRNDEIGGLAKAFQWMARQLKESFENLEQKVAERTGQLRQKNELIRQIFGRYLSDEVVDALLETDEGLSLGGERREITLLASDIRGFTAQSNTLPPEQVIKIINFYLSAITEVVVKYHGTINEIMGDGLLIFFGAPIQRKNDPERAVACAIEMQLVMDKVNKQVTAWGFMPLEMGIGINTGDVVVGNIGSEKRTKYSALGNEVNLTYRIESYSTGGQIFISQPTLDKVGDIIKVRSERQVKPKGIKELITIYEVEGIGGNYNLFLPTEKEIFVPLEKEFPLKYTLIEEKHVEDHYFTGKLIELAINGAIIHCDVDKNLLPSALKNIKINLLSLDLLANSEEKGKVKKPEHKNHKILIVDDVPINIDVLRKLLSVEKYRLSFANSAEKALKIIEHSTPDLILLDVMMPNMSGFEMCRILRSQESTQNIPVIFMTALNSVEDKVHGFEVGGTDYIVKPFKEEELLARVRTHLSAYDLRRTLEIEKAQLERKIVERDSYDQSLEKTDDIYAKVLYKDIEKSNIYVQFTSIPILIKSQLITSCQLELVIDYRINHAIIDEQHRKLLIESKKLIKAISNNQIRESFTLLDNLKNHIVDHFTTEEEFMKKYDYSEYIIHKAEHIKLFEFYNDSKTQYEQNKGGNIYLNLKIQWKLIESLVAHIKDFDKPLGIFLKDKH